MRFFRSVLFGLLFLGLLAGIPVNAADQATKDVYLKSCKACHGVDGVATAAGKKLKTHDFNSPEVAKMSDAELIGIVTKGKGKMAAFGKKLSDKQIADLVAYVRELAKVK